MVPSSQPANPLNRIGDALRSGLSQAFSGRDESGASTSSPNKAQRTAEGKSSGRENKSEFTAAQTSWLQNALGSALVAFGEAVEQRVWDLRRELNWARGLAMPSTIGLWLEGVTRCV